MSKDLVVRDEVFPYPVEGDNNYGEAATGWAEAITSVAAEVAGPGDIATTEVTLIGISAGGYVTGDITNLKFDTAYVQSMNVTGHITRTYTDATPDQVESFTIEAAFNGTVINFSPDFAGDDTELEFDVNGGQFRFKYLILHPDQVTPGPVSTTDTVTIKFSASAKVDSDFFV